MTKKSSFCQLIFRLTPLASADKKELFLVIQNYALLSYLEWPLVCQSLSFLMVNLVLSLTLIGCGSRDFLPFNYALFYQKMVKKCTNVNFSGDILDKMGLFWELYQD